jgi:hypothetical protein
MILCASYPLTLYFSSQARLRNTVYYDIRVFYFRIEELWSAIVSKQPFSLVEEWVTRVEKD